jgi:4-hydroxy-3-methylbut-2-enyl diphosphate reductase
VTTGRIRHQVVDTKELIEEENWIDETRTLGITAGASTPNNKIGETIARICAVAGVDLDTVLA